MSQENKEVIRRTFQAINRGEVDRLDELLADDLVEHEEFPGLEPNKQGVIQFFKYLRTAFPDLEMKAEEMIAEGDRVSVLGTINGTHRGEFLDIPATGNEVTVPFADFFRLEGGRIAEHWGVSDGQALLAQLGVLEG